MVWVDDAKRKLTSIFQHYSHFESAHELKSFVTIDINYCLPVFYYVYSYSISLNTLYVRVYWLGCRYIGSKILKRPVGHERKSEEAQIKIGVETDLKNVDIELLMGIVNLIHIKISWNLKENVYLKLKLRL